MVGLDARPAVLSPIQDIARLLRERVRQGADFPGVGIVDSPPFLLGAQQIQAKILLHGWAAGLLVLLLAEQSLEELGQGAQRSLPGTSLALGLAFDGGCGIVEDGRNVPHGLRVHAGEPGVVG